MSTFDKVFLGVLGSLAALWLLFSCISVETVELRCAWCGKVYEVAEDTWYLLSCTDGTGAVTCSVVHMELLMNAGALSGENSSDE